MTGGTDICEKVSPASPNRQNIDNSNLDKSGLTSFDWQYAIKSADRGGQTSFDLQYETKSSDKQFSGISRITNNGTDQISQSRTARNFELNKIGD